MMTPAMSGADVGARLVDGGVQVVGRGAIEAGQLDQGDVAAAFVGDGGRDDPAALHARAPIRCPATARSTVSTTGAPTEPRRLGHDVAQRAVDHRFAVDRQDLVAGLHAGLGRGRAVLHGADQDLLVVGALDGDADAAAAVALEAVVARLLGVGVAAVAVELLGGGRHGLADQRLPVGLLQRRRGADRAGHQFGQHAAPGPAVGRIAGRRTAQHLAAVALDGEGARPMSPATAPDRRWRSRGRSRPTWCGSWARTGGDRRWRDRPAGRRARY